MKRHSWRFPAQVLVPAAAAALVALCSSCEVFNYADPVDPRLYSDNLIASMGFNQFSGDDVAVSRSTPLNGTWDFAYCYDTWSDHFAYMTFAPVADAGYTTAGSLASTMGESLPSGLASNASVYRVEVVNLITAGDFESGTLAGSGTWTATDPLATATLKTASPINGVSSVELYVPSDRALTFTPSTVSLYQFNAGLSYYLSFRYRGATITEDITSHTYGLGNSSDAGFYKGDYAPVSTGDSPYLVFTAPPSELITGVYVDDFMMKRKNGMTLRLRLQPNQTSTTMIEGRYRFSVWVHADPLASATGNPYPIDGFSVTMNPVENGYNAETSTPTFSQADSGWRELTAVMATAALQFHNRQDLSLAVIEIDIDFKESLPGRVLLAAPDFRMIKE